MVSRKYYIVSLILTLFVAGSVLGQGENKLFKITKKAYFTILWLDDAHYHHDDGTQKQGIGTLMLDDKILLEDQPCYALLYPDYGYFYLSSKPRFSKYNDFRRNQQYRNLTGKIQYTTEVLGSYTLAPNITPEPFKNISDIANIIVQASQDVVHIHNHEKKVFDRYKGQGAKYRTEQMDLMSAHACGNGDRATITSIYTTLQHDYIEIVHEFECPNKRFFLKDLKHKFLRTCEFNQG